MGCEPVLKPRRVEAQGCSHILGAGERLLAIDRGHGEMKLPQLIPFEEARFG